MERRAVIRVAPKFLIIVFNLFAQQNIRRHVKVQRFSSNEVNIFENIYRTVGAVCHAGHTTQSGHYWALIHEGNQWLELNDERMKPRKRFLANLKNVYLLLLEQKQNATNPGNEE
jgi:ubiquitin C-terminal hydrolase